MSASALQVATCAVLLTGVWGLPFVSEEEANEFLGLRRQALFSDYWDPASPQNGWAEKASEYWTSLKTSAQYYMDLGSVAFDTDTARDHINSYMDLLRESGAHLQQQKRKRHVVIPEPDWDPYCA
ncbi:uncharacterized protein C3orf85 homolog [Zootoca vivipara]|uniref:uncharacterized protein C3orf85 homolog n=1 Tax=Zootoca vivipara TaxID=8524 RepID=UPI00159244C5|nr:uncharacterized protein C3orf85 homolog [Zootoca vivipara]